MAWILMVGMLLTGLGILIGLYLPILASQLRVAGDDPALCDRGAVLVVIGTALEIVSVWPTPDAEIEQGEND